MTTIRVAQRNLQQAFGDGEFVHGLGSFSTTSSS
jgi:hypothetical protein